jgi:hypothetical protein
MLNISSSLGESRTTDRAFSIPLISSSRILSISALANVTNPEKCKSVLLFRLKDNILCSLQFKWCLEIFGESLPRNNRVCPGKYLPPSFVTNPTEIKNSKTNATVSFGNFTCSAIASNVKIIKLIINLTKKYFTSSYCFRNI